MPRIRTYESQISPSGVMPPTRRAQVSDFSTTTPGVGGELMNAAERMAAVASQQEVGDVQAKLAKARADWTVHLQERANSSEPGDANFAQKFNDDFSKFMSS